MQSETIQESGACLERMLPARFKAAILGPTTLSISDNEEGRCIAAPLPVDVDALALRARDLFEPPPESRRRPSTRSFCV